MGTFRRLKKDVFCPSKTIIVCGKGDGYEMAAKEAAIADDKPLVAAINQAVLFFDEVDFMFCVDVGVLVDLKERGYDFSKVKSLVCPLFPAECERLGLEVKEITSYYSSVRPDNSAAQLACLNSISDFFPETTSIYTYQEKHRPCSYAGEPDYDAFVIGAGYSTLTVALQWLFLAGGTYFKIYGSTPYSSIANGLESTSTVKEESWYEQHFNRILLTLETSGTMWEVHTPTLLYAFQPDHHGEEGIMIIDYSAEKQMFVRATQSSVVGFDGTKMLRIGNYDEEYQRTQGENP